MSDHSDAKSGTVANVQLHTFTLLHCVSESLIG